MIDDLIIEKYLGSKMWDSETGYPPSRNFDEKSLFLSLKNLDNFKVIIE